MLQRRQETTKLWTPLCRGQPLVSRPLFVSSTLAQKARSCIVNEFSLTISEAQTNQLLQTKIQLFFWREHMQFLFVVFYPPRYLFSTTKQRVVCFVCLVGAVVAFYLHSHSRFLTNFILLFFILVSEKFLHKDSPKLVKPLTKLRNVFTRKTILRKASTKELLV